MGIIVPMGAYRKIKPSPDLFERLQDEWAIKDHGFSAFRERYRTYVTKCERDGAPVSRFCDWKCPNATQKQKRYAYIQSIELYIYIYTCFKYNLLRTFYVEQMKSCTLFVLHIRTNIVLCNIYTYFFHVYLHENANTTEQNI